MARHTSEDSAESRALERLLDEIECGTIEDVDELDEADVKLLRAYYGESESLQDMLDRLREQRSSGR
jgi:hypothetical protein